MNLGCGSDQTATLKVWRYSSSIGSFGDQLVMYGFMIYSGVCSVRSCMLPSTSVTRQRSIFTNSEY